MRYWDASAVVPLLLAEPSTRTVREILEEDDRVVTFWTTEVECVSAIARREREARIGARRVALALGRLATLRSGWSEVLPVQPVRECARRLLRVHPLRTADALQLAAAVVVSEQSPSSLPFVCLDERLRTAAGKEGFPLLPADG